ncbi:MAG: OmpA family protein [Bacteroidales bacterium]
MKKLRALLIICLFAVALNAVSYGQTDSQTNKIKYNTWSVSPSFGLTKFYGEISQYDFYPVISGKPNELKFGGGISISKQFSPIFGANVQALLGKVAGIKRNMKEYFNADIYDYTLNATVSLTDLFFVNLKNKKIDVCALAGVGIMQYRSIPKDMTTDKVIDTPEIHPVGYGPAPDYSKNTDLVSSTVFPIGLVAKYKINENISLGIETTMRNINADDLDCYKKQGTAQDRFGYTAINFTYYFGNNERTMQWISTKEKREAEDFSGKAEKQKIDSLAKKLAEINDQIRKTDSLAAVAAKKLKADEADDDGDGVPNIKDLEPNTPKGNLVDARGRSLPEPKVVKVTDTIVKIKTVVDTVISKSEILFSIYFDFNSAEIKPEHHIKIVEAVKKLKTDPNIKLQIVGHADKTGSVEYNKTLSGKRIQAIVDVLIKSYSIDISRIIKTPVGKTDPLSSTDDAINRRVDFFIVKE